MRNRHGLTAQFARLLLLSALTGGALFCVLQFGFNSMVSAYLDSSEFQRRYTAARINDFQEYVKKNRLAATDGDGLTAWTKGKPLILLEIYRSNILIYSSSYPDDPSIQENEAESPYFDWLSYHTVTFADGEADVVLYSNEAYQFLIWLTLLELVLSFLLFLLLFLRGCRGIARYILKLSEEVQALEGGDLDQAVTVSGNNELTTLAQGLDSMRLAFKEQREREMQSFSANQTMITQMSHDLRTPLTTLLIYTEILKLHKYEDAEQLTSYLDKIDAKAHQIKQLSDNIFEYSLLTKEQIVDLEPPMPFCEVFHDLLSEAVAYLEQGGFSLQLDLDWPSGSVAVHPQYIRRLMDNILSNITKYADPAIPIAIDTVQTDTQVGLTFRNRRKADVRQPEGTHIGLRNMRTMMEKMDGVCLVEDADADSFGVTLLFPKC